MLLLSYHNGNDNVKASNFKQKYISSANSSKLSRRRIARLKIAQIFPDLWFLRSQNAIVEVEKSVLFYDIPWYHATLHLYERTSSHPNILNDAHVVSELLW